MSARRHLDSIRSASAKHPAPAGRPNHADRASRTSRPERTSASSQPGRARSFGSITLPALAVLLLLLAAPATALVRLASAIDWRILAAVPLLASLGAWFTYRTDKRRAQAGEWRIPESTLHLLELLGGWPGAFLAQRQFRHKTAKLSFQINFWVTVLLYQFAALDFLRDWKTSRWLWQFAKAQLG